MALIMRYIDSMHRYMDSYGDPRTKDWPFMSSPFPTLAVCLTYVYLVKVLGPRLMENRKPFHLQNTLIVYNFLQVVFSAWLFYEIALSGWLTGHYNFRCQPVDYSNHPRTLRMVHACWWYYFSKFTEFMDTIFFVLRKKTSQVTTLHVIHHGCMPMSVWFGVKFTPGGHSTFFGLLNTFVHIIMYSYYLFAAMGQRYQRFLWWKKYLTALQMVQFVLIMVHAFQLLFVDCNYPRAFVWWIGMHAVMFFFLFNEFYKSAYSRVSADFYEWKHKGTLKNGVCNSTTKPSSDENHQSTESSLRSRRTGDTATNLSNKKNQYKNGTISSAPSHENGATVGATKAADYYVRGDLPTEITQRKNQK